MLNKKESDDATRASIRKEMAMPRMAKSVRKAELNLDAERVPGQPRVTLPGTVNKIIASLRSTGKGTDCYGRGGRPVSRSPY